MKKNNSARSGCQSGPQNIYPRLIAWEVTAACNLNCVHCRACATSQTPKNELNFDECRAFLDDISKMAGKPILIMTGGEPLTRPDFFDILEYADKLGIRKVLATNATLISEASALKLKHYGINRVSVSIDGHDAKSHDSFRMVEGAFEKSLSGIKILQNAGIEIQINTTITKRNFNHIESIFKSALSIGAKAVHIFLLVPTGRAENMLGEEIPAADYEKVLNWFYDMKIKYKNEIDLKATCAPHFYRILRQRAETEKIEVNVQNYGIDACSKGCLAGNGFAFVSSTGEIQGCGYMPISAGNIKEKTFSEIYKNSNFFNKLRDLDNLKGKCGKCEYRNFCGGCRARALSITGDCFDPEPYCNYIPETK